MMDEARNEFNEEMIEMMIIQVTQFDLTVKALYYTEVFN
jgi:hypothetical protein